MLTSNLALIWWYHISVGANRMWERACSRRRTDIQQQCRLLLRFREQARSHRVHHGRRNFIPDK
ncbi:hypothetical protein EJA71_15470 [Pseudomonas sp. PB106]|nr:hypothetical protein EJA71_15470 [Pseudomonas sp. PB106]